METPESTTDNTEALKQALQEDKIKRQGLCHEEVKAVLEKYRCTFDPQVLLTQRGVETQIAIIPKD